MDLLVLKVVGDPNPIFSWLKNWVNDGQPEELIADKSKKDIAEVFTWLLPEEVRRGVGEGVAQEEQRSDVTSVTPFRYRIVFGGSHSVISQGQTREVSRRIWRKGEGVPVMVQTLDGRECYAIICRAYQLHGEEGNIKGLRASVGTERPTVTANGRFEKSEKLKV